MDKEIYLSDYSYHLPPEKIPLFPNPDKHKTNLLLYQHTTISHHSIENIIELIPPNASLFFNETKVIPARLLFTKETGASIEIFLLRPSSATQNEALESHSANKWNCLIKNKKKWKEKQLFLEKQTTFGKTILCAERTELENEILFQWNQNISFLEILRIFGNIPLPPYIKRPPTKNDTNDYQTIFSKNNGSVAAPTAGLHFTKHILEELEKKQIPLHFLTLHIGAGTFLPIKTENVKHHTMHTEHIIIQKKIYYTF